MYTCICTCMYMHVHAHMYAYVHVHINMQAHAFRNAQPHIWDVHVRMYDMASTAGRSRRTSCRI